MRRRRGHLHQLRRPDAHLDLPGLTERAREMLERAARRAGDLGSPAEAQRLFEAGLARAGAPADQARLHLAAAESAQDAGQYLDAVGHAREATVLFDSLGLPVEAGVAAGSHAAVLISLQDNGGAIDIAEPRWRALDGVPGAERALMRLSGALCQAHEYRGEYDLLADFAERQILLAEAVVDPVVLARGPSPAGQPLRVHRGADLGGRPVRDGCRHCPYARLLHRTRACADQPGNLADQRDLPAALEFGREAMEAARRSGSRTRIDYATGNYLLALWTAGQLDAARRVLVEAQEGVVDPGWRVILTTVQAWFADAQGDPLPPTPDTSPGDNESDMAWRGNLELMHALALGDTVGATVIADYSIAHLLAASGIEDDFMHLWPPLVQAALAARDTALAQRLIEPVSSAAAGIVSPAVAAQYHRLRGLLGAARGDDPDQVERDLRAGVDALRDFGAVGLWARAEEELARWLAGQHRADEARPVCDSARATYSDIGASGWLAQLDSWQTERIGSHP